MLSSELEIILNEAFSRAREARHELMSVEHLLLAILGTPAVSATLRACGADVDQLHTELTKFIDETTPRLKQGDDREVGPTLGFQRVLQRAVFHVQSSGKREVTTTHVLVALFSEKDSHAVRLLSTQQVSRLDVVNYIAHGLSKVFTEADTLDAMPGGQKFSDELRTCLRAAFSRAQAQLHKYCTVEQLLYTMAGKADVHETLRCCGVDVEHLRRDLEDFIDYTTPRRTTAERTQRSTHELDSAIEQAAGEARARGDSEITCDDVLLTIFSEKYSTVAYLLSRQKVPQLLVADLLRGSQGRSPPAARTEGNLPPAADNEDAANELETHLRNGADAAQAARHEFLTVEHLLQAILTDSRVYKVLRACGADVEKMHKDLSEFVDLTTPRLKDGDERAPQPTLGYQRVLQRVAFHTQAASRRATATDVLVAIFSEKHSHAAYLLSVQEVARADVVGNLGTA
jgi:ATP-dependent Clp protease ATP-binding subunit ClpA